MKESKNFMITARMDKVGGKNRALCASGGQCCLDLERKLHIEWIAVELGSFVVEQFQSHGSIYHAGQ